MEFGIYIGGGTLAVAVIAHVVKLVWSMADAIKEVRADMDAHIDNLQRDVAKQERNGLNRADVIRQEFGETASALRQKIHEVETWNRDTFVRKDSFETVINRLEKSMEKGFDKIESRIETMFERIKKPG